jgi:hypothetical protein
MPVVLVLAIVVLDGEKADTPEADFVNKVATLLVCVQEPADSLKLVFLRKCTSPSSDSSTNVQIWRRSSNLRGGVTYQSPPV